MRQIALSKILDVISLALIRTPRRVSGLRRWIRAGWAGRRAHADLERIYAASRCGNYRCCASTRHARPGALGRSGVETIQNAWGAIPSAGHELDGWSNKHRQAIAETAR